MAEATIDVRLDTEGMEATLAVLRTLVSQIGFDLDTAIVSLKEIRDGATKPRPEEGSTLQRYDGSGCAT